MLSVDQDSVWEMKGGVWFLWLHASVEYSKFSQEVFNLQPAFFLSFVKQFWTLLCCVSIFLYALPP